MLVFRLSREPYAHELSGKGASIKGARWNSQGVELIYKASNRSLAMAELAVYLSLATLPDDYMMVSIDIPDEMPFVAVPTDVLPSDWNVFPHSRSTQSIGDEFVRECKACLLKVPSVVAKGDFNWLINPHHPDFQKTIIVGVSRFPSDKRLFK